MNNEELKEQLKQEIKQEIKQEQKKKKVYYNTCYFIYNCWSYCYFST